MSRGYELVRNVLIRLGVPASEIIPEASLLDDLAIDSTELVEVISSLERETRQRIDEKQFKHLRTVADIVKQIE